MILTTIYGLTMGSLILTLYILGLFTRGGLSLFIDGCPMFGCRPSGSFSMYLQLPKENASINWVSNFVLDPVPNHLGCVSDSVNIVCPSNGPFSEDRGYVSLFTDNGTVRWKDKELLYPTLPILDNYGDVTGSDGNKLAHYDADGKAYPAIPCDGLSPIFNMALVGSSYLLLVSGNGIIVVRETNGVPVGSLTLNATFDGVNGTYLPIAQPVINKQRFYLLTKFKALEKNQLNGQITFNHRLFAIDVHESISNRITIAWTIDFPYKQKQNTLNTNNNGNPVAEMFTEQNMQDINENSPAANASLLWNRYNDTLYLFTPDVNSESRNNLLGVRDKGDEGEIVFNTPIDVSQIAMFVSDHCESGSKCKLADEIKPLPAGQQFWVVTRSNEIHLISDQGASVRVIDLKKLFDTSVTMTTKMSLVRNSDTDSDILLFGIKISDGISDSEYETYVVAIDTTNDVILWKVNIPGNMIARGQITGVSGTDVQAKDMIVVYAETPDKMARIFSIH